MKKLRKLTTLFIFCCFLFPVATQAQERITLQDGTVLNVFLVAPENADDQASPLVILMGGGPGNASISQDTSRWLGSGFAQRGWMVAVPISPNNRSFRGAINNELIASLITQLQRALLVALSSRWRIVSLRLSSLSFRIFQRPKKPQIRALI